MLALERQQYITDLLKKNKVVQVSELSKAMRVSEETVRKDLEKLEAQELIHRVHGGAFLASGFGRETSAQIRSQLLLQEKESLAKACMEHIHNRNTLFLDSSTTILELAKLLARSGKRLTVVTHSWAVADVLRSCGNIRLILLGGEYDADSQSFYGYTAIEAMRRYQVDKAFISPVGVSHAGITGAVLGEAELLRVVMEQTQEHLIAADYTKIGKSGLCVIGDLKSVDVLILDRPIETQHRALELALKQLGTAVQICGSRKREKEAAG